MGDGRAGECVQVMIPDMADAYRLGALPDQIQLTDRTGPNVRFMLAGSAPAVIDSLVGTFAELPALEVVQSVNAGVDWLIPKVPPSVLVCSARGVHDAAVSEWVVAALLGSRRRFPELRDAQTRAQWSGLSQLPADQLPFDLQGARVVIVGYGSIGKAVARRLTPFDCDIVGVVSHAREGLHDTSDLPTLLPSADVVVVLTPLTERTRHLVDLAFLRQMREGALFVNASRGPVVDTDALVRVLREGRIRAAVDVTDPEPLPPDHPLWSTPGVMITPHVAGATHQWRDRAYRFAGQQMIRFASGEPLLNVEDGRRQT